MLIHIEQVNGGYILTVDDPWELEPEVFVFTTLEEVMRFGLDQFRHGARGSPDGEAPVPVP